MHLNDLTKQWLVISPDRLQTTAQLNNKHETVRGGKGAEGLFDAANLMAFIVVQAVVC